MKQIPQPLTTFINGRKWSLFDVEFVTADGTFGTYIYALSMEHAALIVEELRSTARLAGQVVDVEVA